MRETDLLISHIGKNYSIKVIGRANFEYAVPLRTLANSLQTGAYELIRFEMSECVTMDSTFMGVLSMLGLKSRKANAKIVIAKANDFLKKLLRDLGVSRLFEFTDEFPDMPEEWAATKVQSSLLTTAETVSEAHQSLVEADAANQQKFGTVIDFAKKDVERLRSESDK